MKIVNCNKEGCNNQFDMDKDEGIIVTIQKDKIVTTKYYCCLECKKESE